MAPARGRGYRVAGCRRVLRRRPKGAVPSAIYPSLYWAIARSAVHTRLKTRLPRTAGWLPKGQPEMGGLFAFRACIRFAPGSPGSGAKVGRAALWGCKSDKNCPRWGQTSLGRPKSDRLLEVVAMLELVSDAKRASVMSTLSRMASKGLMRRGASCTSGAQRAKAQRWGPLGLQVQLSP